MTHRSSWLLSGVPVFAFLLSGCSETIAPAPPADGVKPAPVYSDAAEKTKIGGKIKQKRQLNLTAPSAGKLVD